MTTTARWALLALVAAIAGCGSSPPVRYHTLLAPAAGGAPATAAPAISAPFFIDVLAVGVPPQLDQLQLLVRQGDSTLAVLDNERWAGPLADELRSALSAQLTRQLGTQDIAGLAAPTGKPVLRIKVQLRRLDAWPGSTVQLQADWSLGLAGDNSGARLTCGGRFDAAAPGGYPELVRAQQQAVAALSARIAADARGLVASRAAAPTGAAGAVSAAGAAGAAGCQT